jgi:hypothetical protein
MQLPCDLAARRATRRGHHEPHPIRIVTSKMCLSAYRSSPLTACKNCSRIAGKYPPLTETDLSTVRVCVIC